METALEVTINGEVRQRKKVPGNKSVMSEPEEDNRDVKSQNHIEKHDTRGLRELGWSQLVHETKQELMKEFNRSIDKALDGLVNQASLKDGLLHVGQVNDGWMVDRRSASNGILPEKVFQLRESVLTKLFESSHIRTVYHLFIAMLILFVAHTILLDAFEHRTLLQLYHWEFLKFSLDGFTEIVFCWIGMQIATMLLPFTGLILWSHLRRDLKPAKGRITFIDQIAIVVYIVYQVAFILLPLKYILLKSIPPVGSFSLLMENIRMMLKSHAFIRTTAGHVLSHLKQTDEHSQISEELANSSCDLKSKAQFASSPNFSHYLYFLFAPTLVFRTAYPRTNSIRWNFVVSNMAQVVGGIIFCYHILFRFCFNTLSNLGKTTEFNLKTYILASVACALPGGFVMLLTFFSSLHSWLNAFAEMLRFGDRLFYKDWWNVSSFSTWYRTWNVVVHDWLYTYIYRDILMWKSKKARGLATGMVFILSAAVHEYALAVTLRFFYPILFVFFATAGYGFYFVKSSGRGWNVALWIILFVGWGQMMCLYSMEWYARKNCKPLFNSWLDLIVPHSWFCVPKHQ